MTVMKRCGSEVDPDGYELGDFGQVASLPSLSLTVPMCKVKRITSAHSCAGILAGVNGLLCIKHLEYSKH